MLLTALLARLEERDLLSRTLVVIASDHGEAFLEHGFEGHARNLYDEVTRVPWILLPPFLLEPGIRVPGTVSNVDIWPTLLDLLGLPPLPGADGRSQLPRVLAAAGVEEGGEAPPERPVFAQLDRGWGRPGAEDLPNLVSVTHAGRRLIAALGGGRPDELYDRVATPESRATARPPMPRGCGRCATSWRPTPPTPSRRGGAGPRRWSSTSCGSTTWRALGYVVRPE